MLKFRSIENHFIRVLDISVMKKETSLDLKLGQGVSQMMAYVLGSDT